MEETQKIRRRVQVSRLAKGGHTFEATVEMGGPHSYAELLADLKALVALVAAEYPPPVEEKK